jgi:hypothetical protein
MATPEPVEDFVGARHAVPALPARLASVTSLLIWEHRGRTFNSPEGPFPFLLELPTPDTGANARRDESVVTGSQIWSPRRHVVWPRQGTRLGRFSHRKRLPF